MQSNEKKIKMKKIPKGILVIKGNFTQRQFDSLAKIWGNLQRGENPDWTLPAIQLSERGDIGILSFNEETGEVYGKSVFGDCRCECKKDKE